MSTSNEGGDLVAAFVAARRQPERFADVYHRQAERVLVYFARRTYDTELALDLTAETFAKAFAARASFRGRTDAEAAAWLFAIAGREFGRYLRRGRVELKALRRLGVERPALDDADQLRIVELADLPALREVLAAELALLAPEQRAALELRVVDELPYPVVAARLDVSVETARARVSRGLRTLAGAIDRQAMVERGAL
jgi:RNA polymerase sigma factor (sigma-70 family)